MPVIAMTAFVTHVDRARILNAGFKAFLPKPFTPDNVSGDDSRRCSTTKQSVSLTRHRVCRILTLRFRSASPITCAIFSVVSVRISDAFETASACGKPASSSSLFAVSIRKRAAIIEEETSS